VRDSFSCHSELMQARKTFTVKHVRSTNAKRSGSYYKDTVHQSGIRRSLNVNFAVIMFHHVGDQISLSHERTESWISVMWSCVVLARRFDLGTALRQEFCLFYFVVLRIISTINDPKVRFSLLIFFY